MLTGISSRISLVPGCFTCVLAKCECKSTATLTEPAAIFAKPPSLVICKCIHGIEDKGPNPRWAVCAEALPVEMKKDWIEIRLCLSTPRPRGDNHVSPAIYPADRLLLVAVERALWVHCRSKAFVKLRGQKLAQQVLGLYASAVYRS